MTDREIALSAIRRISTFLTIIMIVALFNMPYGYYNFLRIATFISSILLLIISGPIFNELNVHSILFIATLILWNPIFPIYMYRDTWTLINVGAAIYYGYLTFNIKSPYL